MSASQETKEPKKPYTIQHIVNWYHGNFCARKCFNKEERLFDCWNNLQEFAKKNKGLMMTHKDFKVLFDNDDIKICKLKPNFRKKSVGWHQMEMWMDNPEFDADKFD